MNTRYVEHRFGRAHELAHGGAGLSLRVGVVTRVLGAPGQGGPTSVPGAGLRFGTMETNAGRFGGLSRVRGKWKRKNSRMAVVLCD